MVPWGINLDADDVAADGGILGLGVNDTTLVDSGPYPIMASPVDGDVDYDLSLIHIYSSNVLRNRLILFGEKSCRVFDC